MNPSDRQAFRLYVQSRSPALLRTAYLLTGDRGEAEDLLQEALVKLAAAWHRVQERESTDAYVRRIMANHRASGWRRNRVPSTSVAEPPDTPSHDGTAGRAERDEMWSALATLPPRMRAVLVLRYYEDLSEIEIAAALGCSVGTVKSQASRALTKLRATLPQPPSRPDLTAQEFTSC